MTVDRDNEFAGTIEVEAVGLPDDVAAPPRHLLPDRADRQGGHARADREPGPLVGPLPDRRPGRGRESLSRSAHAPLAGLNQATERLWLTVASPPPPPKPAKGEARGATDRRKGRMAPDPRRAGRCGASWDRVDAAEEPTVGWPRS